jgi:hypothetical protein
MMDCTVCCYRVSLRRDLQKIVQTSLSYNLRLNHLQTTTYIPTPSVYRHIVDRFLLVASSLVTQTQNKTMKFHQAVAGLALLFPLATAIGDLPPNPLVCFDAGTTADPTDHSGLCVDKCDNDCQSVCEYFGIPYSQPSQCTEVGTPTPPGSLSGTPFCLLSSLEILPSILPGITLPGLPLGTCCNCAPAGGPGTGSGQGDPHFKTWRGNHFDYHGECDLVLLHNSVFESGLGLDVHIRTKIRRDMSYISSAALRIGKDLLEVESQGVYWLNGVLSADLPDEFSGFTFSHTQPTDKQYVFEVHLGGRERIKLKTYKDFVSVLVEQGKSEHFGGSAGLMGDFQTGHMIGRDGKTVIDDADAFGQEWQVLDTESSLFHTVRLPQHPNVCTLPPPMQASQLRRRLLETSSVDQLAAEKACEHWGEGKDDCVFDVLTTGDPEMAVVGAY